MTKMRFLTLHHIDPLTCFVQHQLLLPLYTVYSPESFLRLNLYHPRLAAMSEQPLFPHPRRVVTGHDEHGNSIFVADSQVPCVPTPANCNFAVLYETHEFPASNDGWVDPIVNRTKSLANPNGLVLRVVDFKPNTKTVISEVQLNIKMEYR